MKKSKSLAYDLRYVQEALELLANYLISEEVFWPLGAIPPEGESDYPRLTLDGLLLARARLAAHPKSADQQSQVDAVISELDVIRAKRRVAWESKAEQCYGVRLRMWGDYIQEYQDNPGDHADRYAYEVRLRVMLSLLEPEMGNIETLESQLLHSLDGYLRGVLMQTGFIWDPEIRAGFPPDKYWYLYGQLPSFAKRRGSDN
jgi:hypothetical protein